MGIIGGTLGYRVLRAIAPREGHQEEDRYQHSGEGDPKLKQFFGPEIYELVRGKTIIDFGCGTGVQSVDMALNGASFVYGLEIQDKLLDKARELAERRGVSDRCDFSVSTDARVDVILSKDAFEHFADPARVLESMHQLLKPNGYVLASFGPIWLHPYGGHLFSVFPWSHLIFSEAAQIRWRADFKTDGATRFSEVEGGLNQMTIKRFELLVAKSPLAIDWLDTVPIRGIKLLKAQIVREFGSSLVRCKLVPR